MEIISLSIYHSYNYIGSLVCMEIISLYIYIIAIII